MPINLDKAFGIHDDALKIYEKRTQLIASNLANADTPGYKARDLSFEQLLGQQMNQTLTLKVDNEKHIPAPGDVLSSQTMYRVPSQSAADGNTVETQQEKAEFAENNVRYQATLMILNKTITGMKNAFRGE